MLHCNTRPTKKQASKIIADAILKVQKISKLVIYKLQNADLRERYLSESDWYNTCIDSSLSALYPELTFPDDVGRQMFVGCVDDYVSLSLGFAKAA